jgi:transposase
MATIIKKVKKGRPYYYAVESARVNGKPRIVWQKYLGTVDAIVRRAQEARPSEPSEAVIFELGGVASLLGIAQRLGLVELIDEAVPKREQGPSVGQYMVLAAINRALCPCSKLAMGDWYETTLLRRLWGYPAKSFSSQRFWDHMDMVSEKAIQEVEERLLERVSSRFGLDPSLLLYDTTNFFTFLATTNERAGLPQRGHSKAKRHDLRQVGLALMVTRDFRVPLLHRVYEGNVPDVSLFPRISADLIARYRKLTGKGGEPTIVFDKGNVSDDAMERLIAGGVHFAGALASSRFPELLAVPPGEFEDLAGMPGSRAYSATERLWGADCRVAVVYSESFFTKQLGGVTNNMTRCQNKLRDLEVGLARARGGGARGRKPTVAGARRKVGEILSPQFMGELFKVEVYEDAGLPSMRYSVDHDALRRLTDERLGKTLLVTDRLDWTEGQLVEAYRGLSAIERTFRDMKNTHFLSWQPAYHWTDQKIRVHAFYCVLALTLATLARKVAVEGGVNLTLPALLKELSSIREVAVIYPSDASVRPRDHVTLSRMSPRQRKLSELLGIAEVARTP